MLQELKLSENFKVAYSPAKDFGIRYQGHGHY